MYSRFADFDDICPVQGFNADGSQYTCTALSHYTADCPDYGDKQLQVVQPGHNSRSAFRLFRKRYRTCGKTFLNVCIDGTQQNRWREKIHSAADHYGPRDRSSHTVDTVTDSFLSRHGIRKTCGKTA